MTEDWNGSHSNSLSLSLGANNLPEVLEDPFQSVRDASKRSPRSSSSLRGNKPPTCCPARKTRRRAPGEGAPPQPPARGVAAGPSPPRVPRTPGRRERERSCRLAGNAGARGETSPAPFARAREQVAFSPPDNRRRPIQDFGAAQSLGALNKS